MKFNNSTIFKKRIHDLIPGGAHTYSKGDDQFPELAPAAIGYGKGAYLWDIDDNMFLDCSMGLTSVSIGHAHAEINSAVVVQLQKGVNFQRPADIELEMAQKFLHLVPQHQMVKFGKNGSLVITAAIKLARAYTGRKYVAFPGDHPFYSYDDWFIGLTTCDAGVPEEHKKLSLTFLGCKPETLQDLFTKYPNEIACVVSEPIRPSCYDGNCNCMSGENIHKIIEICHMNGALFIQDEMITGFKIDFPGAISKFNTNADLATWGKGIANGYSFCALTGRREIMELGGIVNSGKEKVFLISTTHGGETIPIAACLATIDFFVRNDVIQHNHSIGFCLIKECNRIIQKYKLADFIQITPCPWMLLFNFRNRNQEIDLALKTLVMQEMINKGVLFQGAFVPCFSHSFEEVNLFLKVFDEVISLFHLYLEEGVDSYLVGNPIKPVFRKYI